LYFSVNDMDAQVANVLLTGNDPALAADRQEDLTTYAADRQRAEQDIQQVAVTAAANPVAQKAVGQVLDALGYLGAEFRNITFPGEGAAATSALLAFQVYERDDRKTRSPPPFTTATTPAAAGTA
jgi:hypothetical protein